MESHANKLMNGQELAKRILADVRNRVQGICTATGVTPTLATVLVGDDPSSATYVRMKRRRSEDIGMKSLSIELPRDASTDQVVTEVAKLGADPNIHGILVQHPVPKPIDKRAVFEAIPIEKDVDGVTSGAMGRVILGMPSFVACTPLGIMRLLSAYDVDLDGAHAVVIGRSPILGRPMASMLINAHATVTLCHSRTRNLSDMVRTADLLVAAVGKPAFVKADWVRRGAVIIDAGYNPGNVGDVDFEAVAAVASLITPVPGGVGPMTIATLIDQTAVAAAQQLGVDVAPN